MNDVPYLLRGITKLTTDSSILVSSSKYLNDARLRDWIAEIVLKQNGPDVPAQSEMYPLVEMIDSLRDLPRIEALFTAERAKNPALDAWFNEWFISDYDADYFRQFAPGTLGHQFHEEVIAKNFEIVIYDKPEPKSQLDYFMVRSGQTHDLEHILTGGDFAYMGELVPAWFRITNQFKHLSPELAGELSIMYMFVTLRYTVRTLLHYPDVWQTCQDAVERGMRCGHASDALFMAKYEDVFHLPLADARERLGVREAVFADTSEASARWAARPQRIVA
ncbi:Coq4 family protein [Sphingomonas jatrophae]|uniref:Ubiquinone biosynthesis protein Coq4 n=1 Tax=Sphingomonas jatrophae TaxID=1166337 RepID=A0A1I6KF29_9SPHN|nr:Coq4 family protein [Sphingomonas jatrophae]SFR89806.1 Ubiquinone biosynthesis protein Coq4 [Sphingomonas jatrophae]